ncbi:MAG: SpoIIE family protein phosphatase [Magnetococcales bacterium]|nr:SpoIIE family protein phosphatase [Magnetococcales bacterium]
MNDVDYQAQIDELNKKCSYFKAQVDELSGINIKNDSIISTTRLKLKQKEQAFQLLSTLQSSSGLQEDIGSLITRTLKTLSTKMKMTRSILFIEDKAGSGTMLPKYWLGYKGEASKNLSKQAFPATNLIVKLGDYILSTKDKPVEVLRELFVERFDVQFFICVPVVLHNRITAILLTSRSKEAKPFYPTLNTGDVEALKSIASYLAMSMENFDLYSNLEHKVEERTRELTETTIELEECNSLINESLHYALNMQLTMMPSKEVTDSYFNNFFAIWNPMGIVGGDIYFVHPMETGCLLFVIDCTGHGIPGAFMTMVAGAAFENIVSRGITQDPGLILMEFNRFVTRTLKQHNEDAKSDNGMDMGVCKIENGSGSLIYAGARFNLIKIRKDGEQEVIKGTKCSIGYIGDNFDASFTNHHVEVDPEDNFFIYSDGFQDQVGGPKRRSLGRRRLFQLLTDVCKEPIDGRAELIMQKFNDYMGEENRRDDLTMVGFSC